MNLDVDQTLALICYLFTLLVAAACNQQEKVGCIIEEVNNSKIIQLSHYAIDVLYILF